MELPSELSNQRDLQAFWLKQGVRVARQLNFARLAEWAVPGMMVWAVLVGCGVLLARRSSMPESVPDATGGWSGIGLCIAVGLMGVIWIVAFVRARQRWVATGEGLVRLDWVLSLDSALATAQAGIGEWPQRPDRTTTTPGGALRWRWDRIVFPLAVGACFLAGAVWVPISRVHERGGFHVEAPLAWGEVEAALETLKEEKITEPEKLAALEEKLEALRGQPEASWYSQSSLEASDALRQEVGGALSQLEQQLAKAQQALAQMGDGAGLPEQAAFGDALRALESGAMPLDKAQMEALQAALGPKGAGSIDKEKLQKMLQELQQGAQEALAGMGSAAEALKNGLGVMGIMEGQGSSGMPGPGGGHDPLGFKKPADLIEPTLKEALPPGDSSRAALGDLVNRSAQAPEIDPSAQSAPTAGGGVAAEGQGGDVVWRNEITPAERAVLRRVFK